MIKFILHGGRIRIDCRSNDKFLQALFETKNKEINFLVVGFARPKDDWDLLPDQIERIKRLNKDKKINFRMASTAKFEEELKWADIVLLRGGGTLKLLAELKKIKDLKKSFEGKIIAGSSAGFIGLAKYFYDQDHDKILKGLNIIPIKAISHYGLPNQYNKDCEAELEQLKNYKKEEGLETIALAETEFITRETE